MLYVVSYYIIEDTTMFISNMGKRESSCNMCFHFLQIIILCFQLKRISWCKSALQMLRSSQTYKFSLTHDSNSWWQCITFLHTMKIMSIFIYNKKNKENINRKPQKRIINKAYFKSKKFLKKLKYIPVSGDNNRFVSTQSSDDIPHISPSKRIHSSGRFI